MGRPARRARLGAALFSAAAHLVALAIVAVQAPVLPGHREDAGPTETIIPILVLPRAALTTAPPSSAGPSVRLHRRALRTRLLQPPEPAATPTPLVAPSRPAAPEANPTPSGPTAQLPRDGLSPGVQAALRGRMGCAERVGVHLTANERAGCNERLGQGAATAPYIPTPLAPEIRAYYDAIVEAKRPDPPPVPLKARGAVGMFEVMPTNASGHGPGVSCKIGFGLGKIFVVHPAHGLKLGPLPCFIVPPKGSLTPEADLKNPDEVVFGKQAP